MIYSVLSISAAQHELLRRVTWVTEFGDDGYPLEPRVRRRGGVGKSNPECWYFFRWGDEPKTNDRVLDAPTEGTPGRAR